MCNGFNHAFNCKCGFGGDTSAPGDGVFRGLAFTRVSDERGWHTYQSDNQSDGFCRPTHCPECGIDVFFVRHNGGSVWLDGPLEWPWYKHPCLYREDQPRAAEGEDLVDPNTPLPQGSILGVIIHQRWSPTEKTTTAIIRCQNERDCVFMFLKRNGPKRVAGELVAVSEKDRTVTLVRSGRRIQILQKGFLLSGKECWHSTHGTSTFVSVERRNRDLVLVIKRNFTGRTWYLPLEQPILSDIDGI